MGPVAAALALLVQMAGTIQDPAIRAATLDGLKPGTCVAHRAGLTAEGRQRIVESLVAAGFVAAGDKAMSGVFPPVLADGSDCPKLPQGFERAPGSENGGHHSYPGGLAVHEAFNLRSSLNFFSLYESAYGPGVTLWRDLLVAAPIWHDWAKTLVFQWNPDGTEFAEFQIAGTGAHHILSLAETMKRGLPADLILTQASAHAVPALGNEGKVVGFIRAAAIIARVDPVERGYLVRNAAGEFHVPHFLMEYSIHNLSDADFVVSIPAVQMVDGILKNLGYGTLERNRVLTQLTAERLLMVYESKGLDGVKAELKRVPR